MDEIVFLPVKRLQPHPDNPRKDVGDVTELAESIKANGILQNLTVVKHYGEITGNWCEEFGYRVIIGHRRLAAAKLAGLEEVPCSIVEMTMREQVSTMLTENMQRSDLTVYEQAQGFQMMMNLGCSVEQIAEESGFSKSTVRRRLKMAELDQTLLKEVSSRQLSLGDFDELEKIEDLDARNKCLAKIGTNDFNFAVTTAIRKGKIAKRLPKVQELLAESGAIRLESHDTWSGKYQAMDGDVRGGDIRIEDWDGNSPLIPIVKGQLYYTLDENWGSLRFYSKAKRTVENRKTEEEQEREKKLKAVWKEEEELTSITRKLRSDFVEGLRLNSRNQMKMLQGAISAILVGELSYNGSDRDKLNALVGSEGGTTTDVITRVMAYLESIPDADYPKIIYAMFSDTREMKYTSSWNKEWPKHRQKKELDALYHWLISLGYEMSTDEKQLMDGTHEIFKDGLSDD